MVAGIVASCELWARDAVFGCYYLINVLSLWQVRLAALWLVPTGLPGDEAAGVLPVGVLPQQLHHLVSLLILQQGCQLSLFKNIGCQLSVSLRGPHVLVSSTLLTAGSFFLMLTTQVLTRLRSRPAPSASTQASLVCG